jgi:protease PrsW
MTVFSTVLGLIALVIAPIIFLLWYFYTRDKLNPEPRGLIFKVFLGGIIAAAVVGLGLGALQGLTPVPKVWLVIAIVPVLAELSKYLVVRQGVYGSPEFDEPADGIIFAAVAGLGYATLENITTLLTTYFTVSQVTVPGAEAISPLQAGLDLFAVRGLLGALGHGLWSSFWGYGLGLAKFLPPGRGQGLVPVGLLAAMLSFALFNAMALLPGLLPRLGMVALLAVSWFVVLRALDQALALSPKAEQP